MPPKPILKNHIELIISAVFILTLSALMIKFDFFEWLHDFTRAHEEWELDEIINTAVAVLFVCTIIAVRRNIQLQRAHTLLKAQEKEKILQEKMAGLGRLSSGLAHEINNGLQPVLGLSEIIKDDAANENSTAAECAKIIHDNALHMRNIVDQIMQVSRSGSGEAKAEIVVDFLDDVMTFVISLMPSTTKYVVSYPKKSKEDLMGYTITLDRTGIVQILTNLLTNAAHAMNNKGEVLIEIVRKRISGKSTDSKKIKPGEYVILNVTDKGCGMDQEVLSHAFEPFYTTKEKGTGTGLGLSTSYGIAHKWGGNIFIESAPGKGTVVTVYIPITAVNSNLSDKKKNRSKL